MFEYLGKNLYVFQNSVEILMKFQENFDIQDSEELFPTFWKQYEEIKIRNFEKIYKSSTVLRKFRRNARKILNHSV